MQNLTNVSRAIGLAVALVAASSALAPAGSAASAPPTAAPAQFYGPSGWPGGFYVGPDLSNPYQGSPGYPYYRYGASYGSAFGPPYPAYSSPSTYYGGASTYSTPGTYYGGSSAYYSGPPSTAYPSYSSAGGVVFGDTWGNGYYPSVGRCLYTASAGYGGGWTDPSSYGYYAPSC